MAGFTTVQSVGAPADRDLRDAIARGTLPGPRLLTSLASLNVEQAGQEEAAAIIAATSLSAEALGLGDRVGSLAPGMEADLIAVAGDPSRDIGALGPRSSD